MTLHYKEQTIKNALLLLNNLEIKGVENASRVAMIAQLLQTTDSNSDAAANQGENSNGCNTQEVRTDI